MDLLTIPNDVVMLIEQTKAGITKAELLNLQQQTRLSNDQLASCLHITPRILQGYDKAHAIEPSVAERALTLAQLYARGFEVLGKERFHRWMARQHIALGTKKPLDLLDTHFGIQLLLDELGRIEHGVLA